MKGSSVVRGLQVGAEDAQRIKALDEDMARAQSELTRLNASAAGLRSRADSLQKAIDDAGGPRMKKVKALVAQMQKVGKPG